MQYIVIVDNDYAVGPFDCIEDARQYIETDWQPGILRLMDFVAPSEVEPEHA